MLHAGGDPGEAGWISGAEDELPYDEALESEGGYLGWPHGVFDGVVAGEAEEVEEEEEEEEEAAADASGRVAEDFGAVIAKAGLALQVDVQQAEAWNEAQEWWSDDDALPKGGGGGGRLPESDWMAVRDEQSDRLYYWNRRTGATSWEKPPPVRQATAGEADSQLADAFAEAFAEAALEPLGSADRLDTPSRRVVVVAPSEMRLVAAATELPSELKKSPGGTQRSPHESLAWRGSRAEPKWARESASLRDAFAASTRCGGTLLAPDDANDGRVECPHCKRRFKAAVAERHIPQCKGLKTKPRTVG